MRRTRTMLLIALMLVLAACSGDDGGSDTADDAAGDAAAPDAAGGETVEVDVVAGDIFYEPDGIEVPAGSTLAVTMVNEGALEHDFQLDDGQGTGLLQAGETGEAEIGPLDSSTTAYCTVVGHREAGMEFEITVN